MTLWKQRLFFRLQRPVGDDGDDLGGEVISINGEGTDNDTPDSDTPEDRGDVVTTANAEDAPEPEEQRKATGAIPKARFDEVNERRKTAEQELAEAQAEIERLRAAPAQRTTPPAAAPVAAAPDFDEDAKEQAYIEAMLDGDTAKAKLIRMEINAALRSQAAQEFEARTVQRTEAASLNAVARKSTEDYPYLDTADGEYALGLIVSARDAAIARGIPAHEALADAVAKIAPRFAPDDNGTPSPVLPGGKQPVDTRTKQALERGALDSTRQPPSLQAGLGNRSDKVRVDVLTMDEAQFENLTLAEKKALRGD